MVFLFKKKKPKTPFLPNRNTHTYKESFVTDAILTILNMSIKLWISNRDAE